MVDSSAAFDREVERDWMRFRRSLTLYVTAGTPRALRLRPYPTGNTITPAVLLIREGDVAWSRLSVGRAATPSLHTALVESGFRPVGDGRRRTVPGEYVDSADVATYTPAVVLCRRLVAALRELGVVHPALLVPATDERQPSALKWR